MSREGPYFQLFRVVIPVALLISAVLSITLLSPYQYWADDWAGYLGQADSLIHGTVTSYKADREFTVESSYIKPYPALYPWGLPLLLAGEARLFGFEIRTFQLFNVLFWAVFLWGFWRLTRYYLKPVQAAAVTLMIAFNPVLLHYPTHILSDIPFLLGATLTFLLLEWMLAHEIHPIVVAFVTGAAVCVCITLRTNGVLLLPAIIVRQWMVSRGRTWRTAVWLVAPWLAGAVFYLIFEATLPGGGASHLRLIHWITLSRIVSNLYYFPVGAFDFFTAGRYSWAVAMLGIPLACIGAVRSWRVSLHLTIFIALNVALYCVVLSGDRASFRYMLPLVPFILMMMMVGLESLIRKPGLLRVVQFAPAAGFLAVTVSILALGKTPVQPWHPYDDESRQLFQWVRDHTSQSDVLGFFKPRVMHLFTGRRAISSACSDVAKTSYFVIGLKSLFNEAQPRLTECKNVPPLRLVFQNASFQVFRVGPPR